MRRDIGKWKRDIGGCRLWEDIERNKGPAGNQTHEIQAWGLLHVQSYFFHFLQQNLATRPFFHPIIFSLLYFSPFFSIFYSFSLHSYIKINHLKNVHSLFNFLLYPNLKSSLTPPPRRDKNWLQPFSSSQTALPPVAWSNGLPLTLFTDVALIRSIHSRPTNHFLPII